jgi:hypothetical protein
MLVAALVRGTCSPGPFQLTGTRPHRRPAIARLNQLDDRTGRVAGAATGSSATRRSTVSRVRTVCGRVDRPV